MLRLRSRSGARPPGSKRKLLVWITLLSLLFGAIEFGEPLELVLRIARDAARSQEASGEVVVVGIDDKALSSMGAWPWNRRHLAALNERLFKAGADRVFYDFYFPPRESSGDRQLADAFARHPGKVFVAGGFELHTRPGVKRPILPTPEIQKAAEVVSIMRYVRFWNGVKMVPYRKEIGGVPRRSTESAIAGVDGRTDEEFPIDYSIRAASIPYASAADILSGSGSKKVAGKTVIVGVTSPTLEDTFILPGAGHISGVFIIVLGAETLMQGRPLVLGWLPVWALAMGISVALVYSKRARVALLVAGAGLAVLLLGPLLLEHLGIVADITPGLFLFVMAIVGTSWERFGVAKQNQGAINPVSGLKTVNALLRDEHNSSEILVAARLRRFADVVSSLPPDSERELLAQVVSRLAMGAGQSPLLHGDDGNFFWLIPETELAAVVDRFKALQLIFRNPIRVTEKSFDIDVHFGVDREVQLPLSHRLASSLAAAHAASEEGGCWKIHDPTATGAREWALSLLGELDQAIDAGHVWVAYQPKMALATGTIVGAEALVRWTHATRGPIDPAEFVEMAERHGRIDRLTAFVLNDAARAAASAIRRNPWFTVSVNVSPRLLANREIVDMVSKALRRHKLPGSALVLEITETAAMAEGRSSLALLEELRALGVALSIDDYGTGMSTLDYLRRIPASELKVDKRFAASLISSAEDQAVMRSTIELAHILGMKVVAEGVETAETLQMLREMGCEIGQGYHIGRPMQWSALLESFTALPERAADGG